MNYFYIGLIILFLIIGVYYIRKYLKNYFDVMKNGFLENNEYNLRSKDTYADVYFFYASWCPHSKTAMKTFNDIKSKYNNPDFKLNFILVDAEKDKTLASEYSVKEYPTIYVNYNDKKYEYDANLTEETFMKFLKYVYNA
jgi:thiol-disulfide isomerase/thioredoxin